MTRATSFLQNGILSIILLYCSLLLNLKVLSMTPRNVPTIYSVYKYFSFLPMFWLLTYKLTQAAHDIKKWPRVHQRSKFINFCAISCSLIDQYLYSWRSRIGLTYPLWETKIIFAHLEKEILKEPNVNLKIRFLGQCSKVLSSSFKIFLKYF